MHDAFQSDQALRVPAVLARRIRRRSLLRYLGLFGVSGALGSPLLVACGGSSSPATATVAGSAGNQKPTTGTSSTTPTVIPTTAPIAPAATGASPVASPQAAGKPGGALKIGLQSDFRSLDPHISASVADNIFMLAVYDRLVEGTPDGKLYPGLASSWSVSGDGQSWTFKLRNDVKFHDGTTFNADAVKFNFDRIVDPATKSGYAIFEVGPYDSSSVVDDFTVMIKLKRNYGPFLAGLTTYGVSMVSPTAAKKYGLDLATHPVGTGPFVFKEYVPKDHLVVTRNPDYNWSSGRDSHQGPAYLEQVTFQFIAENGTRTAALLSGQVDTAGWLQSSDWIKLQSNSGFTTAKILSEGYPPAGIDINVTKPPTDDVNVRKAIEYAINRDEVNQVAFDGTSVPTPGIMSSFTWAFNPESASLYNYDPDKANQILDAAGWTKSGDYRSKGGQTLSMLYLTFPNVQTVAEVIQSQLKKVGIKVDILSEDNPAQAQDAQEGKHNLDWIQWSGVDPFELWNVFSSKNIGKGYNFAHYSDPQVDQWFDQGEAETDPAKRKPIYAQIQTKVMQDAAYVPLYNLTNLWAYKKGLAGTDRIDFNGISPVVYDLYWAT